MKVAFNFMRGATFYLRGVMKFDILTAFAYSIFLRQSHGSANADRQLTCGIGAKNHTSAFATEQAATQTNARIMTLPSTMSI